MKSNIGWNMFKTHIEEIGNVIDDRVIEELKEYEIIANELEKEGMGSYALDDLFRVTLSMLIGRKVLGHVCFNGLDDRLQRVVLEWDSQF